MKCIEPIVVQSARKHGPGKPKDTSPACLCLKSLKMIFWNLKSQGTLNFDLKQYPWLKTEAIEGSVHSKVHFADKKRKENCPTIYIRKFIRDRVHSHIWLTASSYMTKYLRISSYIRNPFLIFDFAPDPFWISWYMRKFFFSFYQWFFTSRWTVPLTTYSFLRL
jgi:hypothetical protein